MDNETMVCNTCGHGSMCCGNNCCGGYGRWGGSGHHRFFLLRLILGLAIIAIVFCVGVKVGEFKGEFDRPYGDNFMMHGRTNDVFFQRPVMQPLMYYQASPAVIPR